MHAGGSGACVMFRLPGCSLPLMPELPTACLCWLLDCAEHVGLAGMCQG